jgi:hypothetical protein
LSTPEKKRIEFNVAGITFAKDFDKIGDLKPKGRLVKFVPEPDNPTDQNAIAVYLDEMHVGYVPKRGGHQQDIQHCDGIGMVCDYGYTVDGGDTWNDDHEGRLQSLKLAIEVPENLKSYQRVTSFLKYLDTSGGSEHLIRWAFNQGGSFDEYEEALQETSVAGTDMHNSIEEYFLQTNKASLSHLPNGWDNFVAKYKPEPLVLEKRFFDDTLGVTGQFDFLGSIEWKGNRIPVVIDWKSAKAPRLSHKLQAAIYATNCEVVEGALIVAFGAKNKQQYSGSFITADQIKEYYDCMVKLSEIIKTLNIKPEASKCIKA